MDFPYQPLGLDEIRLLRINTDDSPQISCQLIHATWDKLPDFVALSYCWGSSQDLKTITINGLSFPVTANLYEGLVQWKRNLKKRQAFEADDRWTRPVIDASSGSMLWIDAICINQKDMAEKSLQIPKMSSIYQRCHRVLAWLGPSKYKEHESNEILVEYNNPDFLQRRGDILLRLKEKEKQHGSNAVESRDEAHSSDDSSLDLTSLPEDADDIIAAYAPKWIFDKGIAATGLPDSVIKALTKGQRKDPWWTRSKIITHCVSKYIAPPHKEEGCESGPICSRTDAYSALLAGVTGQQYTLRLIPEIMNFPTNSEPKEYRGEKHQWFQRKSGKPCTNEGKDAEFDTGSLVEKLHLLRSCTNGEVEFIKILQLYKHTELESDLNQIRQELANIVSRPWFSRVWIAQEMAVPPEDAIMLIGPHEIGFTEFMVALVILSSSARTGFDNPDSASYASLRAIRTLKLGQMPRESDMALNIVRLMNQAHALASVGVPKSAPDEIPRLFDSLSWEERFLNMMFEAPHLESTQPHDNTYALLGLSDADVENMPESLKPDYTQPFQKVYQNYVEHILTETKDLRILNFASFGLEGVPSWVPDFRYTAPFGDEMKVRTGKILHRPVVNGTLSLPGLFMGKCEAVFPRQSQSIRHPPSLFDECLKSIIQISAKESKINLRQSLRDWLEYRLRFHPLYFRTPYTVILDHLTDAFLAVAAGEKLDERFPNLSKEDILDYTDRTLQRCLFIHDCFVLDNGATGVCTSETQNIQAGDMLCLLSGLTFLHILRPAGDGKWRMVDRAVLDPMQDSEADEFRQRLGQAFLDYEEGKRPEFGITTFDII